MPVLDARFIVRSGAKIRIPGPAFNFTIRSRMEVNRVHFRWARARRCWIYRSKFIALAFDLYIYIASRFSQRRPQPAPGRRSLNSSWLINVVMWARISIVFLTFSLSVPGIDAVGVRFGADLRDDIESSSFRVKAHWSKTRSQNWEDNKIHFSIGLEKDSPVDHGLMNGALSRISFKIQSWFWFEVDLIFGWRRGKRSIMIKS